MVMIWFVNGTLKNVIEGKHAYAVLLMFLLMLTFEISVEMINSAKCFVVFYKTLQQNEL